MNSLSKDKYVRLILACIVIVVCIWLYQKYTRPQSTENFVQNASVMSNEPVYMDEDTGSIMTSPDFIPSDIVPAWGSPVRDAHVKFDDAEFGDKFGSIDSATQIGNNSMEFNLCSKSCCSDQYPVPFGLPTDPQVCANKDKFTPSNYMCNNAWNDSGCLCMTKKQSHYINEHGGNL